MKTGAMTILFREIPGEERHIQHIEAMTRIKNAGFDAADLNLCLLAAHKNPYYDDNWQREADKVAEAAANIGIELPQCHLPFKSAKVKWRTPEDYAYYIEMFRRAIDVAARIGIPWGVIHPECFRNTELTKEEKLRLNHEEYDGLIDYALSRGLNIAYENMRSRAGNNYCSTAEDLCTLIDSYGDRRIGACWDTGHANTCYRDQYEPLVTVGERLHCTHIDDNTGSDEDLHLAPFGGTIKWESVCRALRDIKYQNPLMLEVFVNRHAPDALKDGIAAAAHSAAAYLAGKIDGEY